MFYPHTIKGKVNHRLDLISPPVPTPTAASTSNLNGTNQYFSLQAPATRLNMGTSSFGSSFWVKGDAQIWSAYSKGDEASLSGRVEHIWMIKAADGSIRMDMSADNTNASSWASTSLVPMDGNWHHIYMHRVKGSGDSTLPIMYIDNVASVVTQIVNIGSGWDAINYTPPDAVRVGARAIDATVYYDQAPAFSGYIIGGPLSVSNLTYLYNLGTAICWDFVEANNLSLYNKFAEAWDLATFNGSTELQARTGKVNGWVLDNINSAPFTGTGLTVDC